MQNFLEKFNLPDKPCGAVPDIPKNLDELSDADLMNTYSEFMSWLSYAKTELVIAEIDEERCANNLRLMEAQTLIGQWSGEKGDTVTLAKARRDTDPQVLETQDKYLGARAYRKLVESVFERCERSTQILSRELSRRISTAPQDRRLHRYQP
jgi:hypothetical protein